MEYLNWIQTLLCVLGMWMVKSGAWGAALHHSDTCMWRSSISPTLPDLQEAYPRSDCASGHVLWYYPDGWLRVVFRRESVTAPAFTLCLEASSFDGMLTVKRTYDGEEEEMLRNGNSDICRPSDSSGLVTITFQVASRSVDLLTISYYRQNPP